MFNFDKLYEKEFDDEPVSLSAVRPAAFPLKQRTSSIDVRKDFSVETWTSLLNLMRPREFLITVNNFSIFRRHISWAISNGGDLRNYITQRYASNMVFMSLLLGAELSVLFNSAQICTSIRYSMSHGSHDELQFWIGISLLLSIVFTILSLFTTFTAWGMVSAISDENAHCMLRSSIGQYVVELPQKFICMSIYAFFWIFVLFLSLLLPALSFWSVLLTVLVSALFFHVVAVFSAFGRLILHTGAIAPTPIFEERYEQSLLPQSLHSNLIKRARAELTNKTSVVRQYRRICRPIDRDLSQEEMIRHIRSAQPVFGRSASTKPQAHANSSPAFSHKRADSTVRFSDQLFNFNTSARNLDVPPDDEGTGNKPNKRPLMRSSHFVDEGRSSAMEEGMLSEPSSNVDDAECASPRVKEMSLFAAIASSMNASNFSDLPGLDDSNDDDNKPSNAARKLKKKRQHQRRDSKVRFAADPDPPIAQEVMLQTAANDSPNTTPAASPKLGVLKMSKFGPGKNEAISTVSTSAPAGRDDQRNWFASIASSIDGPARPPRAPKAGSFYRSKTLSLHSENPIMIPDTEKAEEHQSLLGQQNHDHYASVGM